MINQEEWIFKKGDVVRVAGSKFLNGKGENICAAEISSSEYSFTTENKNELRNLVTGDLNRKQCKPDVCNDRCKNSNNRERCMEGCKHETPGGLTSEQERGFSLRMGKGPGSRRGRGPGSRMERRPGAGGGSIVPEEKNIDLSIPTQVPNIIGLLYVHKNKEGTFSDAESHFNKGVYGLFSGVQPHYPNEGNKWILPFNRSLQTKPMVFVTSESLKDSKERLVMPHINSMHSKLLVRFSVNGDFIDPRTVSGWFYVVVIGN
ncbi:MAG: hypothetical protein D3923_05430 [Candidatus Electrothrix sp. AR3]|nr:hypothetical protein [Candidatus Electrothrix sp. AR3]